jgi:hypothetical protein
MVRTSLAKRCIFLWLTNFVVHYHRLEQLRQSSFAKHLRKLMRNLYDFGPYFSCESAITIRMSGYSIGLFHVCAGLQRTESRHR